MMFELLNFLFPIIFIIMFTFVSGIIIYSIVSSIRVKIKNDNSPLLKVPANIVDKRTDITTFRNRDNMCNSDTDYFVTFEFESGDRIELKVHNNEFGYLVIGDYGDLEFQGTRFISFTRF